MRRRTLLTLALAAGAVASVAGIQLASGGQQATAASTSCQLSASNSKIQHVIYLQFDNVHYNRDAANVPSDLEQMPHLLDFLTKNGTLFTNDHTILISHTAGGILSSLTGLYPDRQGQTVSNSYDYFQQNKNPTFTSSFKYWNNLVDPPTSGTDTNFNNNPNMITDTGKTTPAPWVPYTRAGCDVGGVGTANIELENTGTNAVGDMTNVFGQGSPEWNEAVANPQVAQTDFVGIAIHCSQASTSVCANNPNAKADTLDQEPNPDGTPGGGYQNYQALYGAKYVDPAVTGGSACVNDTSGQAITDPNGNCGFPGFDGMLAKNTLGYVAQMQENGVPVTYGYISDVHDLHVPTLSSDSYSSSATGPGELAHEQQLKAYDDAFASFFDNLQRHGINKNNTLFAITVDEGDHFAGGVGNPESGQSWLVYDHRTCTDVTKCPSNQVGEVTSNMQTTKNATTGVITPGLLPLGEPAYDIHFDDAPAFYVNGQPPRDNPTLRSLERDVGNLNSFDPYFRDANGTVHPQSVPLTQGLVDTVGERAIHMVNADPTRTPSFTMFGNPDFFFQLGAISGCAGVATCVSGGFAWNHGDIQQEIGNTWAGFVGPGIASNGIDSKTWTDHTNLRPTILSLLGLKDDYTDDGRVLVEALTKQATPDALSGQTVRDLGDAYEQVNASFGAFSAAAIKASTKALEGDDSIYTSIENSLDDLTTQRNALAVKMRDALNAAAFAGTPINTAQAQSWIAQANSLISQAQALSA